MTASHAYYQYKDLVQSYSVNDLPYVPAPPRLYDNRSLMGYLSSHPQFSIFVYLLQIAGMDQLVNQPQFMSTLFVCPDELLRVQMGESFFMKLDRNSAIRLVNLHILTRIFHPSTFQQQHLSLLTTRDPVEKVMVIYNENRPILVQGAGNQTAPAQVLEVEQQNNGIIYVLSGLLLPEN